MTIMFDRRFVEPILSGKKIHTIRANYDFWKLHNGKEFSLRYWEGKPYRSKQIEFARRVIHVQKIHFTGDAGNAFQVVTNTMWTTGRDIKDADIAKNDGFDNVAEFREWFYNPKAGYTSGLYVVLHFTDFWY